MEQCLTQPSMLTGKNPGGKADSRMRDDDGATCARFGRSRYGVVPMGAGGGVDSQ